MVLTLRLPGKGAPGTGIVQVERHPEQDKLQKERGLVRYGSAEHWYRRSRRGTRTGQQSAWASGWQRTWVPGKWL